MNIRVLPIQSSQIPFLWIKKCHIPTNGARILNSHCVYPKGRVILRPDFNHFVTTSTNYGIHLL